MLKKTQDLMSYTIMARDGEIGRAEDFYFDEQLWTIRYIVVNTGNWLLKNLVLISPVFIDSIDDEKEEIRIGLSREQVENSPDVDAARPISRRKEAEMARYYQTGLYWSGFSIWGMVPRPIGLRTAPPVIEDDGNTVTDEESHLRSISEITGYNIRKREETLGYVKDILVNDDDWQIESFILNTQRIFPGEDLEFSVRWINEIRWESRNIIIKNPPSLFNRKIRN